MHNSGANQSWQRCLLVEVKLDCVEQSLAGEVASGVSYLTGRFVDSDQPGIFVDDFEW